MILCALFAALIAVGAFIRIPLSVVPFTLQSLFVLLAGLLLGGNLGAVSVCLYIAMGLLGLPVFAEGGGVAYILKPSFGYLIGFVAGAYTAGRIARAAVSPGYGRLLAASFSGLAVIYLVGVTYYYLFSALYLQNAAGLWPLLLYSSALTIPGDAVLCIVAALLGKRLSPILRRGAV